MHVLSLTIKGFRGIKRANLVLPRHVAKVYHCGGQYRASIECCENALRIFMELGEIHDIAVTQVRIGGDTVDAALKDLGCPIDPQNQCEESFTEAEKRFKEAESHWSHLQEASSGGGIVIDAEQRHYMLAIRAWRGVMARSRGELDKARDLFQECVGQFLSPLAIARLYQEMALTEHLAGKRELARDLEEKGVSLQQQMGLMHRLHPQNCYKMIERLKQEKKW